MTFRTMQQAEAALQQYIPIVKQVTGTAVNLDRMWPLMQALGNPQQQLKVIHVAGTSGKTSTSYYIASLLQQMGFLVGLTVSPHIDSVTERVQINGKPLSEEKFCDYVEEVIKCCNQLKTQPSYFELLMALAYYVFFKEGVDYAVIETGMGGLLDASNVACSPQKICVITDIGYDHMHILGNTLYDIAVQKAGIIHEQNAVFMYKQQHVVMKAVRERIEAVGANLHMLNTPQNIATHALPDFQKRNFFLASTVADYVAKLHKKTLTKSNIKQAATTYIPARMDTQQIGHKTVIMDGAHNSQKMLALVTSLKQMYPSKKVAVVLAMKQGKEYKEVLDILLPITETLVVTLFKVSQDVVSEAVTPALLADYAKAQGCQNVFIQEDPKQAYKFALDLPQSTILVTGSFYLLAQLRKR